MTQPESMRLVADESCDFTVVVGARDAGHDVVSIAEHMPGVEDEKVIELAASERRLLLTEDQGFWAARICRREGKLGRHSHPLSRMARSTLAQAVVNLLAERADALYSRFVVMEPGRIRVTQLVL